MLVVVRCPRCRGAARVARDVIGVLVECPRCGEPFLAIEEAVLAPSPRTPATPTARPERPERRSADPADTPNPDDDPNSHALPELPGRLSVSVLIGLALLPFLIPLVWVIAPFVIGRGPELSVATPLALAVAASALCLAVVYTVDWSAGMRIRGVLLLLAIAYSLGVGLYFLRKDTVDRVREFLGPGRDWHEFRPPRADYRVKMPGRPVPMASKPLGGWRLECFRVNNSNPLTGQKFIYVVGTGDDRPGLAADARWTQEVRKALAAHGGVNPEDREIQVDDAVGRQWVVNLGDGTTRVVQVLRRARKVYYLAAEGPGMAADHDLAQPFFDSFQLDPPK